LSRLVEELGRSESDLSGLDLLVIQIDGIHMDEDMILVAAIGSTRRATSIRSASWCPRGLSDVGGLPNRYVRLHPFNIGNSKAADGPGQSAIGTEM
jgi:hypothetical protein